MRKAVTVLVAASMLGVSAWAAEPELEGESLRKAIAGKTVSLSTPMGGLPISYRPDGTMQGRAGVLADYAGAAQDSGRWWIVADQLCQRWNTWLSGTSYCFKLRQQGSNIHWTRSDGLSGVATVAGR